MLAEITAPSQPGLQKNIDLRAQDCGPLTLLLRLVDSHYPSSWRLYGINPIATYSYRPLLSNRAVARLVTKLTELFWLVLRRQPLQRLTGGDISRK
jgi:hypothetical protein